MGRSAMKLGAEATGMPSRISTLLVLCGFCVPMAVGVPAARADVSFSSGLQPGAAYGDWEIASDKAEYALGEPVHVTYTAVNNTSSVITFHFWNEPELWLRVLREEEPIWDSALMFLPYEHNVILDPGEVLESQFVWEQIDNEGEPVGPGQYELRGMPGGEDQTMTITILPEPCVSLLICVGCVFLVGRNRRCATPM
jgi:hypothetical protein